MPDLSRTPSPARLAARTSVVLAVTLLAAVPAAAYPAAKLYWLEDGPMGPVGDGVLEAFDPLAGNIPNSTQPSTRPVFPGVEANPLARFVSVANDTQPTRLYGYLFGGIWPGRSAVLNGNLTATVYEVPASGDPLVLGTYSVAIDANTSYTPDPTAALPPNPAQLVPPDPTDPEGTLAYEQAALLQQLGPALVELAPLVLRPPAIFNFGFVDLNVSQGSRIAIAFHLDPGSSPIPSAVGVGTLDYDSILTYSYVYVPWYAPDPVYTPVAKPTPTKPVGSGTSNPGTNPTQTPGVTYEDEGKDSPGASALVLVGALGAVALAMRRRRA